jgi:hypothetical protein
MVKVSVLYPHKNDAKFNMDYYLTTNDVRAHRHLEGVEPPRRTRVQSVGQEQSLGSPQAGARSMTRAGRYRGVRSG